MTEPTSTTTGDPNAQTITVLHQPPGNGTPAAVSGPVGGPAPVDYRRPAIDLDKLEREGAREPFDFVLKGRRYLMADPKEVDWQDLVTAMSNPVMFFRLVMPADDRDEFFRAELPSWKMDKLLEAYLDHYGLPNVPNAGGLRR